jgi:hypothetical protein
LQTKMGSTIHHLQALTGPEKTGRHEVCALAV